MNAIISFDIGYASIGWCVLDSPPDRKDEPVFLGTGVVTFPTDDCLASQRRALRRTRRHIRSTRMRIERMKRWLVHRGVLTREELDKPGHAAPFWLAAAALDGKRTLTAWELWTVLRWYAHNRGYDGNTRWSGGVDDPEDTEKVKNAANLMREAGASTMCHTVCHRLDLNPADEEKLSSMKPYKTLNAAFPRKTVSGEVAELLRMHDGKVKGLDSKTIRLLISQDGLGDKNRAELLAAGVKLPKRYVGGLLFGQLVPRFDNRIISRCPITWAVEFDKALAGGSPEDEARKAAEKFAKVPAAKCPEYLEYRFARVLANLRAGGKPLSAELRRSLFDGAKERGRFTPKELRQEIEAHLGSIETNLEAYFNIHPDADKQLVFDPAKVLPHSSRAIKPLWSHLGDAGREKALAAWTRGKGICPAELLQFAATDGDPKAAESALRAHFDKQTKNDKKNTSWNDLLMKPVMADYDSGRAPYARPVLRQVVEEVLAGFDPTRTAREDEDAEGRKKERDGILYAPLDPKSRVRELMDQRPLDNLTNNHLVRHRLLILERLLDDILSEFGIDGKSSPRVVVEVARELKEFSGMTAKEIASELNSRLKDFKGAVAYLEEHAPHLLQDAAGRGGIIRKCRIAMDMNWHCPFTGEKYDAALLPKLEREHIIPYATRNTNALHALVLTWPEVNRMKGKRTAKQFILESADLPSRQVPGLERLSLFTPNQYDAFVKALDTKGHADDERRKKARKALLQTADFEDKELGFTEGQLTQSSHLMKLAMGQIKRKLGLASVDSVPGPVTAEIRKSWKLTGTLAQACPEVLDADGKVKPKDEIRGLTHMHHALDAATLALAAHYMPFQARGQDQKGKIWQALLKRNQTPQEKDFLLGLKCCAAYPRNGTNGGTVVGLKDLDAGVKNALSRSMAECRVMQHVPSDRSGTKAELTTWSILCYEGKHAIVLQRNNRNSLKETAKGAVGVNGRRWEDLPMKKEAAKLFQQFGDKLSARKKSLVRRGILKLTREPLSKLIGPNPIGETSKMWPHGKGRGALVIGENYAIALDPEPTLIPFHNVTQRLELLTAANGGKKPRLIRNGTLIEVEKGTWRGCWRVVSIKNSEAYGISVDLAGFGDVGMKKGNAKIPDMVRDGLKILPKRYTGHVVKP